MNLTRLLALFLLLLIIPQSGARADPSERTDLGGKVWYGQTGEIRYEWDATAISVNSWAGLISVESPYGRPLIWSSGMGPLFVDDDELVSATFTPSNESATLKLVYKNRLNTSTFNSIFVTARIINSSLTLNVSSADSKIAQLRFGNWNASSEQMKIYVPYNPYSIQYDYLSNLYVSGYINWTSSNATRIIADAAIYGAKTDGNRNNVEETFVLTASPHVADVYPHFDSQRSRFFGEVAGKLVLDIVTTEAFSELERKLSGLIKGGLKDCFIIVHNWQRYGFDNAFPSVLPASPQLGGNAALSKLIETAGAVNCKTALHENYYDYYPNSEVYDHSKVALNTDGTFVRAWRNQAKDIQSFAVKPTKSVEVARVFAPEIAKLFGLRSTFLDVNPSFLPWHSTDMDATETEGGKFSATYRGTIDLLRYLQDVYRGPVFGEGKNHFYWTGFLDGVEAQADVGFVGDRRDLPLIVDFDLREIHPFQSNHGMGYYFRWPFERLPVTGQTIWENMPLEVDDQSREIYRAQEVAFGHSPYISGTNWDDPSRLVQELALVGPIASRYATALMTSVRYWDGQSSWIPLEIALLKRSVNTVRISYNNGLELIANNNSAGLRIGLLTLEKGSFVVNSSDLYAFSAVLNNSHVDFAYSSDSLYAFRRASPNERVRPTTVDFGPITTDGQVWLRCEGEDLVIRPFSSVQENVYIELDRSRVESPSRLFESKDELNIEINTTNLKWSTTLRSGHNYVSNGYCRNGKLRG